MILLRILLFPFSLLFAFVTSIRNWLFNSGLIKSVSFEIPVINVGNLRVGGTGKTPHVEYLIRNLMSSYNLATLSRGYGRETRGFLVSGELSTAKDIGDEPLQISKKFQDQITVSVCEDRALAIPRLVGDYETELVILDDAFQHRFVKPKVNILLTTFTQPFFRDFLLPTGMLRESHYGARRADIIIVTKCPESLSDSQKETYNRKIRLFSRPGVKIFFSRLKYGDPIPFDGSDSDCPEDIYLISGLANPSSFVEYVNANFNISAQKHFPDHYDYYSDDVDEILSWLDQHPKIALLCTEKDYVKLNDERYQEKFIGRKAFYLPIEIDFGIEDEKFMSDIKQMIG